MASNWRQWAQDRFGLQLIQEKFLHRRVPKDPWYFGDGTTLTMLLAVLVATGTVMTLTYSPTPDGAYESVRYITHRQPLGWFVRGLHYWSAGLMVVMLFVHLFRQIAVGGYKPPREGTWLIGVVLFFSVITISFIGYTLRWDERAIYAVRVALTHFYRVPAIGDELVVLIQGGRELGALTLTRLYAVHVIFIPLLLMFAVGYHVYLVVLHGTTLSAETDEPIETAEEQKEEYKEHAHHPELGERFFPDTMARMGIMVSAVFLLAVALTVLAGPRHLDPEANLVRTAMPYEEWWFAWYSALIALLPPAVTPAFQVLFPIALFVTLVSLPFVDRGPNRGWRKRPYAVGIVVLLAFALVILSSLRISSPWTGWPSPEPPPVPEGAKGLSPEAETGRRLFARYGCNTCHAVAGHGPQVGPDLARTDARYSYTYLRNYISHPPDGVPMPSYADRLTEEELERLAAFVLVAQTFPRE
ncbi:MAG: cytochrome b N-terminal domain-containing protein [Armatimonadetes bacterium]|nr:cytochrome b N-terminal domain-containing protein [Armatimonadota bacterium]